MAITLRENKNLMGIIEPETQEEDTISLFADDSCVCLGKPASQTKEARITMGEYEGASGSALHEGKTMIMKIGKTRRERLTKQQLGVSFKILEDDAVEKYLGDLVGNAVSEEKRFEKPMSRLATTGSRWNREKITVYGRALVVNTLMMPVICFRANVNGMTKIMTAKILKEIKQFVWKDVPTLKWGIAVRSVVEGGIGVRDPGALIDGMRITLIKHLQKKADQPWAKWLRRKERRLSKEWRRESAYHGGVKKEQLKKLKETCVFESAIRVWHELRGTVVRENDQTQMIVKIGKTSVNLEETTNRMIYDELIRVRFGVLKEKEKRVNYAMTNIGKMLTPQQRQFWWRVAHRKFQTNSQAHKWKVDPNRGRAAEVCSVCKGPKENWDHMEYGCTGVQTWLEQLENMYEKYTRGREVEKWVKPTREEWRLEGKR